MRSSRLTFILLAVLVLSLSVMNAGPSAPQAFAASADTSQQAKKDDDKQPDAKEMAEAEAQAKAEREVP